MIPFKLIIILSIAAMTYVCLVGLKYFPTASLNPLSYIRFSGWLHNQEQQAYLLIYTLLADRPGNAIKRTFNSTRVRSNRDRYVALHEGIDYFQQTVADPLTRLIPWQKIKDYPKVRGQHEWVWLLDSDAFIMNGETSALAVVRSQLSEELKKSSRQIDIMLCKDWNGIHTGSFFLRSSPWTDKFIEKWVSYENDTTIPMHHIWWEQAALTQMYNRNEMNVKDHVSFIDQRKINS
jgi:hypothetical protein